nr:unnamed protein product [Hydra vulgaris]XP_012563384.1 unnamed protein product [Hydra vulgaris]
MNVTQPMKKSTLALLVIKALFPRLLFFVHGLLCIWIVSKQEQDNRFWYLLILLFLLVFEGLYNAIGRKGLELHWFCPSAFFYCVVLIVSISFFRHRQIQCIVYEECSYDLLGEDFITRTFSKWSFLKRIIVIEQTGLFILIIGRWMLPSGTLSRQQFSQIILIYIGTAADIVEFNDIYANDVAIADIQKIGGTASILHGVMGVWGLSVLQFSLTIILPEEGLKQEEKEEYNEFQEMSYLKKIKSNQVGPTSYMHYKTMLQRVSDDKQTVTQQTFPTNFKHDDFDKEDNSSWRALYDSNLSKMPIASLVEDADPENDKPFDETKKSKHKKCIKKYLELVGTLLALCMQDGPFFIFRFVLVTRYEVVTEMMILLIIKNALVIFVQTYRMLILYCTEPKPEDNNTENSEIRSVMEQNTKTISRLAIKRHRAGLALTALARMQNIDKNKDSSLNPNMQL